MSRNQLGRASDRDVAPAILLGVYPHAEAESCECLVPGCEQDAVGFATFLWRGIVAFPVCCAHGMSVLQVERPTIAPDVPSELGVRHVVLPRRGSSKLRSMGSLFMRLSR